MNQSVSQPLAVAPAVMPGTDIRRSAELVEAEFTAPYYSALTELPSRGHHSSLLGRTAAMLQELSAELTSYGWRLVPRPGADQLRAEHLLRSDVDTLADVRGARAQGGTYDADSALAIELLGPLSLSAQMALPHGEKILSDHGARRDVADSLAAGAAAHIEHLRRTAAPSSLSVTVLEPDYRRIRSGSVRTVSGYRTLRAVSRDEARDLLGRMVSALRTAGADEVLLDFGGALEAEQVQDYRSASVARVDGFGMGLVSRAARYWEQAAELVEAGARLRVPVMSRTELAAERGPEVSELGRRISQPWTGIGMPLSGLEAFTLSPLASADRLAAAQVAEATVMRAATRTRDAAEALTDQIRG